MGDETPIHLSFDIDAVDPELAPSTGTPVPGGLTMKEARAIASSVHRTGNMVAMDLVEVNPLLRPGEDGIGAEMTVAAACDIVRHAFGAEGVATNGELNMNSY
jgi:arginase